MSFNKIGFILLPLVLVTLSSPLKATENTSIKGSYIKLPGKQFKFDGKTVEVMEFLSFYCGHCYSFEASIPVIKGNFPKKIKWRIVPIYWGNGSPKPGEAYLLAEEAGKGEQMKKAIFNALFVEKKDIGSIAVLEEIGRNIGLGFVFSRRLRVGNKAGEAQRAMDMSRSYGIQETPTVILAGNLKVSPRMSGHSMDSFRGNIITIIKSILQPQ